MQSVLVGAFARDALASAALSSVARSRLSWLPWPPPQLVKRLVGKGYISGVVESSSGPEAGVWVIAETDELGTTFAKIVVTDDDGRFVLPELPDATYDVWVRGYGLVDSQKVRLSPDRDGVALEAVIAPTAADAAQYYPGNYWYSLIEPPPTSDFPGTGPDGNGISEAYQSQAAWVDQMKQSCQLCHQLGNEATRVVRHRDDFDSAVAAWDHRVQTGQRGNQMSSSMSRFGRQRALEMFADWTERIASGELPPPPPRPTGLERNVVVTLWDWGQETSFIHDEVVTDKRTPTVNANGPVYGVSAGHGTITVVDPIADTATELTIPVRPDPQTMPTRFPQEQVNPSYYWGEEIHWGVEPSERSDPHNPMMDHKGRVWMTSTVRQFANPDWCREGSDNPYTRYFPLSRAGRHASYYDPADERFALIHTCYGTHHLQFGEDDDDTLWFSGDVNAIGWLNTRLYDETGDEQISQGWCPTVIDTNGDGKIARPWNEPTRRGDEVEPDPRLDTRISGFGYGIIPSPIDDSVWITRTGPFPGRLVRLDRGDNPTRDV